MSEKHPNQETQEERDEATLALNKLIKRKLIRDGRTHDMGKLDNVSVATIEMTDGTLADLTKYNTLTDTGNRISSVGVTIMHSGEILGKSTEYVSIDGQPFQRMDLDAKESGAKSMYKGLKESMGTFEAMAVAGIAMYVSKDEDVKDGIDGLPITAQETNELISQIQDAKPIIGRSVRGGHNLQS